MTTVFVVAFVVAVIALIECICVYTKWKRQPSTAPAPCYLVLSIPAGDTTWMARVNGLTAQMQWMDDSILTGVFLLLPAEASNLYPAVQDYCTANPFFQCGTLSELEKILTNLCFPAKNDCILSKEIV